MAQPARHEVDRPAMRQKVTGVAVPERMVRDPATRRYHTEFHRPVGRLLYPAVGRRAGRPDQPVALSDVAELERAGERRPQEIGRRASSASASEILRPGPPLDQEQEPRPGIRGSPDQGLDLAGLQVLREFLRGSPAAVRVPRCWGAGPWVFGCAGRRPVRLSWAGSGVSLRRETLSPSDCLIWRGCCRV